MIRNRKSLTMDKLLQLAEDRKLNDNQKNRIVELVENMDNVTDIQRERFITCYGLNTNGVDLTGIDRQARIYKCTVSAIRRSLFSVRHKLVWLEEEFKVLEDIVKECTSS